MQQIILITSIIIASFLFGCSSTWKLTKTHVKNTHYFFETPPKWMIARSGLSTILSRHGPSLDKILISKHLITEYFPFTKLKIYPEMLPHEIGEVIFSRIISTPVHSNVFLTNMQISEVDSREAVNLTVSYQINDIVFTDMIYAFIENQYLYEIRYTAAKRQYYDESLDEFNSVVNSFKVK